MQAHKVTGPRYCMLDFDGVVLRKHAVHPLVARRCAQFVSEALRIPLPKAELLNRELYEAGGHTAAGLCTLGHAVSLADFNDFVYGGLDYRMFDDIWHTHRPDIASLQALLRACREHDIMPLVFSNAPDEYCYEVLDRMAADPDTGRACPLITSLVACQSLCSGGLKPARAAYEAVERGLGGDLGAGFVLVDDKLANLTALSGSGSWTRVLLMPPLPDGMKQPCARAGDVLLASSLGDVVELISGAAQAGQALHGAEGP